MTLKISIVFSITLCLYSCGNNQTREVASNNASTKTSLLNCYRYINNNDTVLLKTILVNGFMTGTLVYNFYQKDKSRGTIQGKMKDSLLIADYTYMSEGTQSVRQVAFKLNGKTFIEGYGETENNNQKTIFKNIDSLNFDHSIVLGEVECEK
ncbi:MAG: hypothetical protein ABIN89_07775 [Chitinophagaceae bacterium]